MYFGDVTALLPGTIMEVKEFTINDEFSKLAYQYLLHDRIEVAGGIICGPSNSVEDDSFGATIYIVNDSRLRTVLHEADTVIWDTFNSHIHRAVKKVYVTPKGNYVIDISDSVTSRDKVARLASIMVPVFFPQLFIDKPLTDNEKAFLTKASMSRNSTELTEAANIALKDPVIRDLVQKQSLSNLVNVLKTNEVKNARKVVAELKSNIAALADKYALEKDKLKREEYHLFALENHINSAEFNESIKDFIALFENNPKLEILQVKDNGLMEYRIKTRLNYFDRKERFFAHIRQADQQLMDSIFCANPTFEIETYADITVENGSFRSAASRRVGVNHAIEIADDVYAVPNPHIMTFNCFGTADLVLHDLLGSGNYAGFIMQTMASASNANLVDVSPMRNLEEELFIHSRNKKVLYNKVTKTHMTVEEAIEYVHTNMEREGSRENA